MVVFSELAKSGFMSRWGEIKTSVFDVLNLRHKLTTALGISSRQLDTWAWIEKFRAEVREHHQPTGEGFKDGGSEKEEGWGLSPGALWHCGDGVGAGGWWCSQQRWLCSDLRGGQDHGGQGGKSFPKDEFLQLCWLLLRSQGKWRLTRES